MQIVDILGLLVPNVWTALSQLCASAVLFFLMYKLAYKPVRKILDARADFEQSKISEAEELISENKRLNDEAKEAIIEANKTAEQIVSDAHEEGEEIKKNMIQAAKEESDVIKANAQRELELQKAKLLDEMHDQLVDATISATEKMLNSKLNAKADKENIDAFIKEVINQ